MVITNMMNQGQSKALISNMIDQILHLKKNTAVEEMKHPEDNRFHSAWTTYGCFTCLDAH